MNFSAYGLDPAHERRRKHAREANLRARITEARAKGLVLCSTCEREIPDNGDPFCAECRADLPPLPRPFAIRLPEDVL